MEPYLAAILIVHVISGLAGTILSVAVLLDLAKSKTNYILMSKITLLSFLSFLISWVAGGFYYLKHYGTQVEPIIIEGEFPWIHNVLMETKEHVFLFLPFLSVVLIVALMQNKQNLKGSIKLLTSVIVFISISIAVIGIAISGAASNL